MKHTVKAHKTPCKCGAIGECHHNDFAEITAIRHAVRDFAREMEAKLICKFVQDGYTGWDSPDGPREEILKQPS